MRVKLNLHTPVVRTPRVLQLEGLFDLPPSQRSEITQDAILPLDQQPWQIGLIVGPSGCGKSTLARELFGDRLISGYEWSPDHSIIDAFPAGMPIAEITGLLCSVGFSSPPSWLRPFRCLSNGEQFRVTLARALADPEPLVVIDEFTSVVDRTVAQIASHAVAKAVRKQNSSNQQPATSNRRFVAISCHDDIIDWLQPDWIYHPALSQFQWRSVQSRPPVELDILRCHRTAWRLFAPHHYLSRECAKSAHCYVGSVRGRPAVFTAVMSYCGRINGWREHRTVCLPDFQGIGLGNAQSDYLASLYSADKPYFSISGHPAIYAHRNKSPDWQVSRRGFGQKGQVFRKGGRGSFQRITASFKYVGTPRSRDELAHVAGIKSGRSDAG